MAAETAIFTALPNGVHESGDFLRVTVFVTPRLSTDGAGDLTLAGGSFPAFADWPAALGRTSFGIAFDGLGTIRADPDPDSPPPDSQTWHLLFDETSVADGKPDDRFNDLSNRVMRSFPVATTSSYVLGLYTQVAETFPVAFPPVTAGPLADLGELLGRLGPNKSRYYPTLDKLISDERTRPEGKRGRYLDRSLITSDRQRQQLAFAEAYRFYDRPGTRDPLGKDVIPPKPTVPPIDFHGFVSFCGDYPLLLRSLGIAVDLLVPFQAAIQAKGRIQVDPKAPPAFRSWMEAKGARPWTRYEFEDRRFLAEPRFKEADLVDGMLRFEFTRRFLVNQIDVDGSVLKTVDFAANVQQLHEHLEQQTRSMTDDASSLPALRTGGFAIARDGRAGRIVSLLDKAADHQKAVRARTPAELCAEDVTRGYRLDIEDQKRPGRWLSLHEREGTYRVKRPGHAAVKLPIDPDEGYVKSASGSSVPNDDDLYLHETLIGWDGWSLAAKRPGKPIKNREAGDVPPNNPTDFPLFTAFTPVPGTLPRLRFGHSYRFRARAVDLAGNSVPEPVIAAGHTSDQHTFRRFEPVPSPAVIPRRPFTEGESLLRMVIRSTLGILPPDYVELARVTGLPGHADQLLAYRATNERHLAAPLAAEQLAEWHGEFDAAFGKSAPQAQIDEQFDVAARESGSFLQPDPDAFVFNPDPAVQPTDLADPNRAKGAPLKQGEYVCYDTDDLELPYLPDPLSRGASFTTLPGEATTRLQPWKAGAEWYERSPLRIRIEHGDGAPVYNAAQRLLRVFLPQAEVVTVRLSSYMEPEKLALMGVWMLEHENARANQQALAELGLHWMLTPAEALTLVHAVEKPLEPPTVDVPSGGAQRQAGETFAALAGAIVNHAKSTGRLDVEARWKEPVDDLAKKGPSNLRGQSHVGDLQLEPEEDDCLVGRDDVPATATAQATHQLRHEFGDTKHRRVTYHAVATTRFREYFPPEITNDRELITHVGPESEVSVPSSRRPDPPDVQYVVPTWTWEERIVRGIDLGRHGARLPSTLLHTRTGGGLRVYMKRPWYSSGAGELLGVVLEDQPWFTHPIDRLAGLEVSAVARAHADEWAERLLAEGLVEAGGRASAAPAERLLDGVLRVRPRAPRIAARKGGAAQALSAHAAASETVLERLVEGSAARFTDAQLAVLDSALGAHFLPSGDPQQFVTHWGLDPIWGSAPVQPGPYIHQFPLRVAVGSRISLLEAPGHVVTVIGHQPHFDRHRKLWYCDLQLDAGRSYFPFVRLALARYQPDSIAGQHLSRVAFPDFAQLVAERAGSLTRVGRAGVAVSLRGPGGYTENAQFLYPFDDEQRLRLSRFAVAQVERLPAEATTDLAWAPAGDEVRLDLTARGGLGDVRYSGRVPLPTRAEGEQLRLALREYEILATDESEAEDHIVEQLPTDFFVVERPIRYRLVYADHLPL